MVGTRSSPHTPPPLPYNSCTALKCTLCQFQYMSLVMVVWSEEMSDDRPCGAKSKAGA